MFLPESLSNRLPFEGQTQRSLPSLTLTNPAIWRGFYWQQTNKAALRRSGYSNKQREVTKNTSETDEINSKQNVF